MIKLTVLYGHPTDTAVFDDHYASTHDPLVRQIPNLQRFEDVETLQQSMSSEEGSAATDDVPNFATGGVTIFASEAG